MIRSGRRTVRGRGLALGLAATLAAGPTAAATVRVPAEAPTIGAGLAAVAAGDTVLVAPGLYAERVILPSNVSLRAEGPPGAATIDAGLGGPCVDVAGGSEFTRLEGFRLVGGRGGADPGGAVGGALRVQGGFLTVLDCTFEDGRATFGGGTAALGAWVTFRRCTWRDGVATFGGGHFQSAGHVTLEDAEFDAPQATDGGGVYATNGATVTVRRAVVRRAQAGGDGGGLHLASCVATLSRLRIEDARAGGRGGGLCVAAGGQVIASHCTILRSAAAGGGGGFHVSCDPAAPGGAGPSGGDELAGADCALLSVTQSELLVSSGAAPAAGAVTGAAVVRIATSIVVGNTSGVSCLDSRATLEVTCSDLYANGAFDLEGLCAPPLDPANRALDPHLCDLGSGDVTLCANSPLVDPGCGDAHWGSAGVACGPCGPTPAAPTTWGRVKARYR
jgi:hypothetical protein